MARSADSAMEAMRRQGSDKAIGVPATGRGLPWHSTDRNPAGDILSYFMRAAQALDAVHNKTRATGKIDVKWQLICRLGGNIDPCRGFCRTVSLWPASGCL